jgi:hypothetical protein
MSLSNGRNISPTYFTRTFDGVELPASKRVVIDNAGQCLIHFGRSQINRPFNSTINQLGPSSFYSGFLNDGWTGAWVKNSGGRAFWRDALEVTEQSKLTSDRFDQIERRPGGGEGCWEQRSLHRVPSNTDMIDLGRRNELGWRVLWTRMYPFHPLSLSNGRG